jgi:hypothetical protein
VVPGARLNPFAHGRQSALAKAHGLYRMIQPECNIEELRELIAVPPNIERVLRAYAKAHVEDAQWIESCLKLWRKNSSAYSAPASRQRTCQTSMTASLIPSSKPARPRSSGLLQANLW